MVLFLRMPYPSRNAVDPRYALLVKREIHNKRVGAISSDNYWTHTWTVALVVAMTDPYGPLPSQMSPRRLGIVSREAERGRVVVNLLESEVKGADGAHVRVVMNEARSASKRLSSALPKRSSWIWRGWSVTLRAFLRA